MEKLLYTGSFDPVHNGHVNIIERGSRMCEQLTVGIGVHPEKRGMFTPEERQYLIERAVAHLPNVRVTPFEGLTVDFALREGIGYLVRGIRNGADAESEMTLALANRTLLRGVESVWLPTDPALSQVSSSVAKGIVKEQGDVSRHVSLGVKQALEGRSLGQYLVGITGGSGSGKTTLTQELVSTFRHRGIEAWHVDLDRLGHDLLSADYSDPVYERVRTQIGRDFGKTVILGDGGVNRRVLGPLVFGDEAALDRLFEIVQEPLLLRLRDTLRGKRGVIFIDGAILVERELTHLVNHNLVLACADEEVALQRLLDRDRIDESEIRNRLRSQTSVEEKESLMAQRIVNDGNGEVLRVNTSQRASGFLAQEVGSTVLKMVQVFGGPKSIVH